MFWHEGHICMHEMSLVKYLQKLIFELDVGTIGGKVNCLIWEQKKT